VADVSLAQIFLATVLANNFVLAMFLGLCPFIGVSGRLATAGPMGVATTFVMLVASLCAYALNWLVSTFELEFLRLISYIVVIAAAVQLVEMFVKKYSPALFRALGIYLPLITTNCAVLGVALFQTAREYSFLQALTFAIGAGAGFSLAMLLMAGLRERLSLARLPNPVQGAALSLMLAGLLSLTFMGFAGIGAGE
jgi:electron transport complex protein RnfA